MKKLTDLPADIDALFNEKKGVDEKLLQEFLNNIGNKLRDKLSNKEEKSNDIRMSRLGIPNLRLWYDKHFPVKETASTNALKFIYGDLVEALVLFLSKQSGHTVEEEQEEVDIDGIKGHKDAKIDGVTTDIKSASRYGFKKFAEGTILKGDDPFGYVAQLSAYMHCDDNDEGAFLAVNKESGEINVLPLTKVDTIDPVARIKEIKEVLSSPTPPTEKCYPLEPMGKGGNMKLSYSCSVCPHKKRCWENIRTFLYSTGPVELAVVKETPRVPELTSKEDGGLPIILVKEGDI